MNRPTPAYNPPSKPEFRPDFKTWWADFDRWLDKYVAYLFTNMKLYVQQLNTGGQGFAPASVASASTIEIAYYLTHISGSTTVSTILTPPGFSGQIVLIADAGFSTNTAGNISAAKAVPAGQALILNYDPVATKWYPFLSA